MDKLHSIYGDDVSLALHGLVGEYGGLLSGLAFSDTDNLPSRIAARGGVGAPLSLKTVRAIIVDKSKILALHDRKKVMWAIKDYGRKHGESPAVKSLETTETAMVTDLTNHMGALPVRNFFSGQLVELGDGPLKIGGDYIRKSDSKRGGEISHACMPGFLIKCSNVSVDANDREIVYPLELETIGLLGTNCGLTEPNDVAILNETADDLDIDIIDVGAMLAMLMDGGQAEFGDMEFMKQCLEDIRVGNERGQLLAQGTARIGKHFNIARVPVIKEQAISAYDHRVVIVTRISIMVMAQTTPQAMDEPLSAMTRLSK